MGLKGRQESLQSLEVMVMYFCFILRIKRNQWMVVSRMRYDPDVEYSKWRQ
jgi:hypothetical protein